MKAIPRLLVMSLCIALLGACTPDEEVLKKLTDESLYFSTDTVFFDTLLTTRLSPTYRATLYNPNRYGVIVPGIRLSKGSASAFTLTINGEEGKAFSGLEILGGDSLQVLISATLGPIHQAGPVRSTDYVEIEGRQTNLVLDAWGEDARFINELIIKGEETWDSTMPYVIDGAVLVDTLSKLTIGPGVEVVMGPAANFYVKGTLLTKGTAEKGVVFRNARTDVGYREAPGQWGAIYFLEGSKNNELNYTTIKNGSTGLRIGSPDADSDPDVIVANCLIANMSSDCILAYTSDVYAYNTVAYNAARYVVGNLAGGNYRYEHCTFTNYPSDFQREEPAMFFSENVLLDDGRLLTAPLDVTVVNTVMWGSRSNEIEFDNKGGSPLSYQVTYSLLKTTNAALRAPSNLVNIPPRFISEARHNYRPDSLSPLVNSAGPHHITTDLRGAQRDSLPDIGAYEWKPLQKEKSDGE